MVSIFLCLCLCSKRKGFIAGLFAPEMAQLDTDAPKPQAPHDFFLFQQTVSCIPSAMEDRPGLGLTGIREVTSLLLKKTRTQKQKNLNKG